MSWSTSELRVRLAHHETSLSPPVKYFYWPFQGGTSFVEHLCYLCLVFVILSCMFIAALSYGHLKGRGWPIGSCLWCLLWFCYFPIWYPGTSVVLDCIDSFFTFSIHASTWNFGTCTKKEIQFWFRKWTIPSLLYQTRRKKPLVHKGLNYLEHTLWGLQVGNIVLQFCENVKTRKPLMPKVCGINKCFHRKELHKMTSFLPIIS